MAILIDQHSANRGANAEIQVLRPAGTQCQIDPCQCLSWLIVNWSCQGLSVHTLVYGHGATEIVFVSLKYGCTEHMMLQLAHAN